MNASSSRGFSTIELLIAFAILLLVLPPLLLLAFGGQTTTLDASLQNSGVMRVATQIRDAVASTTADWNATPQPWATTFYTSTNATRMENPCLMEITATTTWMTEHTRGQYASASTYVPSIAEAIALAGACDSFPSSSDWDTPERPSGWTVSPSAFVGAGTGIALTEIDDVPYAVITGMQNGSNKPDLFLVNISDPSSLQVVSPFPDIAPNGYTGIAIGDDGYAYVLVNDTVTHLHVIRLTDTAVDGSDVVATISLPDTTNAVARSVFYRDHKIFVGTQYLPCPGSCTSNQNNEFHIFDVSNPAMPTSVGRMNINHNINDIVVSGSYAYLATSDDSGELMVINVSNPGSMVHPDTSGMRFNAGGSFDGTSVYARGTDVYLGRERSTGSGNYELYRLNASTPTAISVRKQRTIGLANNTEIEDIHVAGDLAFVLTSDHPSESFQVWDIEHGAGTTIVPVSACSNMVSLSKSKQLAYDNDLVYIVNENQATLNIVRDSPDVCAP